MESQRLALRGELDGLQLTGMTDQGLELLQHFVERTNDVQTVAAVILHALPSDLHEDARARAWVAAYKSLLDRWRLWHQRAFFDMEWYYLRSLM